jgi:hypothetical protein
MTGQCEMIHIGFVLVRLPITAVVPLFEGRASHRPALVHPATVSTWHTLDEIGTARVTRRKAHLSSEVAEGRAIHEPETCQVF